MAKKTVKKGKARKAKAPARVVLNFQATPQEAKEIKAMARKFVRGNVTALIHQALTFVPKHTGSFKNLEVRASTRK